jgi:hypothetical protein
MMAGASYRMREVTASRGGEGADNVKDWRSASEYMERGRNKNDRPLARNTRIRRALGCSRLECFELRDLSPSPADCFIVKLHATDIVTYHADGAIGLNTGGWETVVTSQRINRFTPRWLSVHSERRYIPLAERLQNVREGGLVDWGEIERAIEKMRRLKITIDDEMRERAREEAEKIEARNRPTHESYWIVHIAVNRRWEDGEWRSDHEETIRFDGPVTVKRPDLKENGNFGLDLDRPVEHRLPTRRDLRLWRTSV